MAVIASTFPTLVQVASRTHDKKIMSIAEMMEETNEVLEDIPMIEGNEATGHVYARRIGLPTVYTRGINEGVPRSRSETKKCTEVCALYEAQGAVDEELLRINGNSTEFRLSEDKAFIQAMGLKAASGIFYANTTTSPKDFTGLTPRYNSTSGENADQIVGGAGSNDTDNTSIWLVGWSPDTVYGFYPKGSQAGLKAEDLGRQLVADADGNTFLAFQSVYKWHLGLAVKDPRYVIRIPNIEVSDLTEDAASGAKLITLMVKALERIQSMSGVQARFYCNRTIREYLRLQIINKVASSTLTEQDVGGRPVVKFCGVPVRQCEAILNTEALVS
jgi:hypothetical protein